MSDVLQSLFGGTKSTSGPVDATPSYLKNFNQQLTQAFNQVFQGTGQAAPYSGPQFEGVTAPEQGVLDQITGGLGGTEQGRQGYLTNVLSGQYLPGGGQQNPFLQQAIADAQRTTLTGLGDQLERSLPGKFTAAGQFVTPGGTGTTGERGGSSPFDTAAAIATRGAADAASSIATQMSNNAWNTGIQQQQQAAQVSQQEIDAATKKLTAVGLPREIQGSNVNLALQTWQTQLSGFLQALNAATGVGNNVKIANQSESTSQEGIIPGLKGTGFLPNVSVSA